MPGPVPTTGGFSEVRYLRLSAEAIRPCRSYASAATIGSHGCPSTMSANLPLHSPVFEGIALAAVVVLPTSWVAWLAGHGHRALVMPPP
jgi:hypothetical protein